MIVCDFVTSQHSSDSKYNMTSISVSNMGGGKSQPSCSAFARLLTARTTENAFALVVDGLPTEDYFRNWYGKYLDGRKNHSGIIILRG